MKHSHHPTCPDHRLEWNGNFAFPMKLNHNTDKDASVSQHEHRQELWIYNLKMKTSHLREDLGLLLMFWESSEVAGSNASSSICGLTYQSTALCIGCISHVPSYTLSGLENSLSVTVTEKWRILNLGLSMSQRWVVHLVLLWSHLPLVYSPGIPAPATDLLLIYAGLSKGGIRTQHVSVWRLDRVRYTYRPC